MRERLDIQHHINYSMSSSDIQHAALIWKDAIRIYRTAKASQGTADPTLPPVAMDSTALSFTGHEQIVCLPAPGERTTATPLLNPISSIMKWHLFSHSRIERTLSPQLTSSETPPITIHTFVPTNPINTRRLNQPLSTMRSILNPNKSSSTDRLSYLCRRCPQIHNVNPNHKDCDKRACQKENRKHAKKFRMCPKCRKRRC